MRQLAAQHPERQQRNQRQREDQGADERRRDRQRHRLEDPPFVTLQREDRNVRGNDDEHREQRRPPDLVGGVDDDLAALRVAHALAPLGQPVHDVLDDDHGAVDDDAEVHRSETQQVRRHAHDLQAEERRQERQRDDDDDRQAGAQVRQEQVEHQRDQQRPFHEVAKDRGEGLVHQPRAVVERHDGDPGREGAAVEFGDLRLHSLQDDARVLALAHHHDAGDDVVVLVLAHGPEPRHGADGDRRQIADQHRGPVARRHHDAPDVVGRAQQADAADRVLLRALGDVAAAGIGVAASERVEEILEGQLVGAQLVEVRLHLVLLDEPAHADDVGNARNLPQAALDHPVLQRAQVRGRGAVAAQAVTHDLAHGRGVRRDVGLHAGRNVHAAQSLGHLSPHQVDVGVVVVGDDGVAQPELGVREHADRVRQSRERGLDRQRHLLFDLLGGAAGEERDDRHLRVGDVGEGLDGKVLERDHAAHHEQQRSEDDEQRLVHRVVDQPPHGAARAIGAEAPEVTPVGALAPARPARPSSNASRYWRTSSSMLRVTT